MSNLVRFTDPFAGLTSLHSQLDDMFNNLLGPGLTSRVQGIPTMDVYTEGDKQLVSEIQAPGFSPDDVEITVNNGVLEIKGEKHEKEEPEDEQKNKRNYMVRESHSSFYRSIVLPKHADADNVKAEFKDGLLKVVVPFKELPKPKKIAIEASSSKK